MPAKIEILQEMRREVHENLQNPVGLGEENRQELTETLHELTEEIDRLLGNVALSSHGDIEVQDN